ncbi:hypothetical protein HPS36_14885 [Halorubrum salinarum]|uniref:Uncharacterized protein n=1 Tax=Halorubrum salinarum TaxID=2739057 RepID=A0A7D3Y2Y7_9EURY|nr:LamG-like jellyroll fold domain-containing protein [Halorubrum salinarum]QKG94093.1 hypothetical protein HPS36_14885 [Halorubrum salinarum]
MTQHGTVLTIGGQLGDDSATVFENLDDVQFTDAASSMGSWSATVPSDGGFADAIFEDIYIYHEDDILFGGELESFDDDYSAGTTTLSGRGALVTLDRVTDTVTYSDTTVYEALRDAWSNTQFDVSVLPPNRELFNKTYPSESDHIRKWGWEGDDDGLTGIDTSGAFVERNRLVIDDPNLMLDDTNGGTQYPSIRPDTSVRYFAMLVETASPVTEFKVGLKQMNLSGTQWDTVSYDTPQRFHVFHFEFADGDDRYRPMLETTGETLEILRTELMAPDPDGFATIDEVELEGTVFENLQRLHELGAYTFTVRDYGTLDIEAVPVGTIAREPDWRVTDATRTLDFTDYANVVTVHGRTRNDGTQATATRKNQSEIDELAARGVGDNGEIQHFEKNPELETQSEVDSRAERLLEESVNERDEAGTLEIAPQYVAPGFTYPVSNWGDAFQYGSQIGTNSLYFDGTSHAEFEFTYSSSDGPDGGVWTTELWLHPDCIASLNADEWVTLLHVQNETAEAEIRLYGDGSINVGEPAGSAYMTRTDPGVLRDGDAQRLSVVWRHDERRVYVDGQLEAEYSSANPSEYDQIYVDADGATCYIGADGDGNHHYTGGIDDVRFWVDSGPRSQATIRETYDIDLLETEADLGAMPVYFRFDDMTDPSTFINDGDVAQYNTDTTNAGAEFQDAFGQLEEVQYSLGTGDTISLDFDISGRIDTELIKTQRTSRSNRRSL